MRFSATGVALIRNWDIIVVAVFRNWDINFVAVFRNWLVAFFCNKDQPERVGFRRGFWPLDQAFGKKDVSGA